MRTKSRLKNASAFSTHFDDYFSKLTQKCFLFNALLFDKVCLFVCLYALLKKDAITARNHKVEKHLFWYKNIDTKSDCQPFNSSCTCYCRSVFLSVCLFVCSFVRSFVYLFVCLFVWLVGCLFVWLFV